MKQSGYIYYLIAPVFMLLGGCRRAYLPPAIRSDNNRYLVVEGLINIGQDSTVIRLSRTINISGTNTANPEPNAKVVIETDRNTSYTLHETDSGRYISAPLNLDTLRRYRLKINTADGHAYLSDFVQAKIAPPIDTFYYNIVYHGGYDLVTNGVSFFAGAHDPANKTKYYRWDYTETYIFQSELESDYEFDNKPVQMSNKFRPRPADEQIHTCYLTKESPDVLIESNATTKGDIVTNKPIAYIPSTSEKILHRYSINLRQYAITPDAYEFWQFLKKNTEQLGSIFDAQPFALKSNIHSTSNPGESVIGYVSAGTFTQKRLFFDKSEEPIWLYPKEPKCSSHILEWTYGAGAQPELISGVSLPIGPLSSAYSKDAKDTVYNVTVGYYNCTDCRYHDHGVTQKPKFWK